MIVDRRGIILGEQILSAEKSRCKGDEMSKEIKVIVVTQDDPFYIPVLLKEFFDELDEEVSISRIVCLDPFNESFSDLLIRMYRLFGLRGFLIQGFSYVSRLVLDAVGVGQYSVDSVAEAHRVPVDHIESVNTQEFVQQVESEDIDVILSASAPEIFEETILSAPNWGCLNIHTAKLPKYKGMMPTFWALFHGESELGVTVHEMVEDLDAGRIAEQTTFEVMDLESLHEVILRGKRVGGRLAAKTLSKVGTGDVSLNNMTGEESYFSFPTVEERKQLQSKGWRMR